MLLVVLTGLLGALAFPPFGLWPLIWVAFVPMLLVEHVLFPRALAGMGLGLGVMAYLLGFFLPFFDATSSVVVASYLPPTPMRLLAGALAALALTIIISLVGRLITRLHEATNYRWFLLVVPVLWVGLDYWRNAAGLPGGTYGYPAYALYGEPWLIQPVSIFAVHGLDLLILLVNWGLAAFLIARLRLRLGRADGSRHHEESRALGARRLAAFHWRVGIWPLATAALLLLAWTLASMAMLGTPSHSIRVAAIQAGPLQDPRALLASRTTEATARGARLIVWHEEALWFGPSHPWFSSLTEGLSAYLVTGYTASAATQPNQAAVIAPGGRLVASYAKQHPVTFLGEVPAAGSSSPVVLVDTTPISPIICYDLDFTDSARQAARAGARLLATPSADVPGTASLRHYTLAVFRAVENRAAIVKADVAYDSTIIDPYGRILAKAVSRDPVPATLVADVPIASTAPLATAWGDWVGQLCLALAAFFALLAALTGVARSVRRRATRQPRHDR
ncbi:MAG TPA: nitrilase-related carbon-nitrogen hydrolase [Actinomycetes bacterium]|jgi:apolipoprotein N-acyltransferase|nr:nitrilase-related carbon-nitrogen hydrolase [Actinomycetes bacterium]